MTCTFEDLPDPIARAEAGGNLSRRDIAGLLSLDDQAEVERLYQAADRVRAACQDKPLPAIW